MSRKNNQKRIENSPYKPLIEAAGNRLFQLREAEKLSMDKFVEQLTSERRNGAVVDISKAQYGRLELGQYFMDLESLIAFCKFYNVSADYILFGNNSADNVIVNLITATDAYLISDFLERLASIIYRNFDPN